MSEPLIQPLPWSVLAGYGALAIVKDAQGVTVLSAVTCDEADLIVKAVNAYAVMVNALTMAEQAILGPISDEEEVEALASIRAALAIAKGEA